MSLLRMPFSSTDLVHPVQSSGKQGASRQLPGIVKPGAALSSPFCECPGNGCQTRRRAGGNVQAQASSPARPHPAPVAPPSFLRPSSVPPPFHLRPPVGGGTEVERRKDGGRTEEPRQRDGVWRGGNRTRAVPAGQDGACQCGAGGMISARSARVRFQLWRLISIRS